MSVTSYPILKLKPRTNFYLSVFLFFLMFSYIFMSMQMRSFVYSLLGQGAISPLLFYLVLCLEVHDIWQLKYRLFYRSNHFSFLLFFYYF